jgi:tetratricopeptide (TPR) repeat protein
MKRIRITILLLMLSLFVAGQDQQKGDSLKKVLQTVSDNTDEKISILLALTDQLLNNTPNKALEYATQALNIAEESDLSEAVSQSLNKISNIYWNKGELKLAMDFANMALKTAKENDQIVEVIIAQRNIGRVYNSLGDYDRSSKYFIDCLELSEKINDKQQISKALNSIGYLYFDQKNYEKALEYFSKSLEIARSANLKVNISAGLNNVAATLHVMGDYDKLKSPVLEAIKINEEIGRYDYLIINYMNLGVYYYKNQENRDSVNYYYHRALDLAKKVENIKLELDIRLDIAKYGFTEGDIESNISELLVILQLAQQYGFKKNIYNTAKFLEEIYSSMDSINNAYKYNLLKSAMKDSLDLNEKLTELSKLELLYEFDKNEREQKAEQQRKELVYIIIGITLVTALLLVFSLLRRYQMKSKLTNLEKLKLQDQLAFKNKELTSNVMSLMKKNEMLNKFSLKLIEIEQGAVKNETKTSIHNISKELQKSIESEIWKEFEVRFQEVHSDFYNKLIKKYPDLTPNEQRLSAFLKLNMSTKDISELTGQTLNAIDVGRFRLRKKLNISGTDENLINFLSQI